MNDKRQGDTVTTDTIPEGAPVRFTTDHLGLLRDPDDSKFDGVVNAGDLGTYVGPHPRPNMAGWHLIKVERDGETFYAGVWPNHFIVVTIDYFEKADDDTEVPLVCADCGRPTLYSYEDESYHHALNAATGCFLIPAESRPDDTNHPLVKEMP